MRFFEVGILGAALLLAVSACEQRNQSVQAARETTTDTGAKTNKAVLNDTDRKFLDNAVSGNITEQNIGRLVLQRSQNKDVKDYAQMLVDDHTKNLRKVVDLMNQKGLPQAKGLPEVKREALGKLDGLSGLALDQEFVTMMVQEHEKDIAEYRQAMNATQDEDVKYYVMHTLPMLQEHLQKAQQLQEKLATGSNTK
jgi:putative membrane protein